MGQHKPRITGAGTNPATLCLHSLFNAARKRADRVYVAQRDAIPLQCYWRGYIEIMPAPHHSVVPF